MFCCNYHCKILVLSSAQITYSFGKSERLQLFNAYPHHARADPRFPFGPMCWLRSSNTCDETLPVTKHQVPVQHSTLLSVQVPFNSKLGRYLNVLLNRDGSWTESTCFSALLEWDLRSRYTRARLFRSVYHVFPAGTSQSQHIGSIFFLGCNTLQ